MSTHDYNLANASGAAFRSDLNDALAAIVSQNSGTSWATTFAYQRVVDTTLGVVKRRNAANSDWLTVETIDETLVLSRSSNTVLDVSDKGKTIRATGSYTQTFSAVSSLGDGWFVGVRVEAGATLTLDPDSTETVDGSTTLAIVGPASGFVVCNGSALYTIGSLNANRVTLGTVQASTSGTAIDFTGIPAGTKRITVNFTGVSTNGSDTKLLQIGDSGGIENSGYLGVSAFAGGTNEAQGTNFTAGCGIPFTDSGSVMHGSIVLTLEDSAAFRWCVFGVVGLSNSAYGCILSYSKALTAELDRVRFTTSSGSDTFDAGEINITYER